jgi:peptidoglycan hydrolase CwlO-like protein
MNKLTKVNGEIVTEIVCTNCGRILSDPLSIFGSPHVEQCFNCFISGEEVTEDSPADLEKELKSIKNEISDIEDRIEELESELQELESERDRITKLIKGKKKG